MPVTQRRKLLKAAVGIATVSYVVACGQATGGESVAGAGAGAGGAAANGGAGAFPTVGNLPAPPGVYGGSGGFAGLNTGGTGNYTSGNLVAPPPPPPPPPPVDAGAEDAAVPPGNDAGDAAADAAPSSEDTVDSGP